MIITTEQLFDKVGGVKINSAYPCSISQYESTNSRNVDRIIIHYTGNERDKAKNNAVYFMDKNTTAKSSAHYFVDDNSIYASVGLNSTAWHAGNDTVSRKSIGIEMCTSGNFNVSEKTKDLTAQLTAKLLLSLNLTYHDIYRHFDITGKLCPRQMANRNNKEWNDFKELVKCYYLGFDSMTPKYKDDSLRGVYTVTRSTLRLRDTPNGTVRKVTRKGSTLYNYGYFDYNKNKIWLFVTDGVSSGFVNPQYLRKEKIKL